MHSEVSEFNSKSRDTSPAAELQALVCELAGFESGACQALLHEADCVQVVNSLASGKPDQVTYDGNPQAISALAQLLQPHASPAQQAVLSAAAAAAAARPQQLSAQQEVLQLLQEPLVKTALSRMRSDPQLAMCSYGAQPAVSKAMGLLKQVLDEDQATSQVVELMRSAAAAAHASGHHQHQQQQEQQRQNDAARVWHVAEDTDQHQQQHAQHKQRQRSPARTAVIARSASTHAAGGSGEGPAGRGATTNP